MLEFISNFKRYLVPVCIAFIAGICLALSDKVSLQFVFSVIFCLVSISFIFMVSVITFNLFRVKVKKFRIKMGLYKCKGVIKLFCVTALCGIIFVSGFLRMTTAEYIQSSKADRFADRSYFSKILVTSAPVLNSKRTSVSFGGRLISYTDRGTVFGEEESDINIQMFCTYPGALNLNTGDVIETYCSFSIPDSSTNYGDFDYNIYLRQKEISLVGFSKYVRLCLKPYDYKFKDKFIILGDRIRKSICKAIDDCFNFSPDYRALLKSILTGDKSSMSEPLRDAMSKSGISHISAVSGMHVSILFSAVSVILGMVKFKKELILIILIPVLLVFMTVASFSPSVMRAVIMLILFIAAYLIGRDNDPITALFIAAFIILFINPYTLFSISFLLSFGSSLSILVFAPLIKGELLQISKIPFAGSFIANSFSVTISSFLGTAYFSVYFFGYIVFSGLIVNLWVIPIVPILFCTGYMIWLFKIMSFKIGIVILKYFITPLIELILRTAYFFKNIPALYPYLKLPSRFQFAAYLLFLIFLYSVLKFREDKRKNR